MLYYLLLVVLLVLVRFVQFMEPSIHLLFKDSDSGMRRPYPFELYHKGAIAPSYTSKSTNLKRGNVGIANMHKKYKRQDRDPRLLSHIAAR